MANKPKNTLDKRLSDVLKPVKEDSTEVDKDGWGGIVSEN